MEYGRLKKGTLPPQPGPDPDELRNFRVFGWPLFLYVHVSSMGLVFYLSVCLLGTSLVAYQ